VRSGFQTVVFSLLDFKQLSSLFYLWLKLVRKPQLIQVCLPADSGDTGLFRKRKSKLETHKHFFLLIDTVAVLKYNPPRIVFMVLVL